MSILVAAVVGFFTYSIVVLIMASRNTGIVDMEDRLRYVKDDSNAWAKEANKKRRDAINKTAKYLKLSDKMRNSIIMAGLDISPEEFALLWVAIAFFPGLFYFSISRNFVLAFFLIAIGAFAPIIYVNRKAEKQKKLFEEQLGDALLVLANSMRAGFSFVQGMDSITKDLPQPIKGEFSQIVRELSMGADLETTLNAVTLRMENMDMKLLTTAVVIQRQVGGNLTEILDIIAKTIRDRFEIKRTIKTLTAQGRISGTIIGLLPVFLLVVVSFINFGYMSVLYTTSYGWILLGISLVLEILGFVCINRIVDLKY